MNVAAKQVDFIPIRARLWNRNYGGGRFLLQERVAAHEVFIGGGRHGDHECFFLVKTKNKLVFVMWIKVRACLGDFFPIISGTLHPHLCDYDQLAQPMSACEDLGMQRDEDRHFSSGGKTIGWHYRMVAPVDGGILFQAWWGNATCLCLKRTEDKKHIYNPPLKNIEGLLSAENRGATNTGNTPMPPACGDQISEWRSANFMELGAQRTWCVINDWMPTRSLPMEWLT